MTGVQTCALPIFVVENFAPGVTERLGIGPATLQAINPRLIYGSSSGYGKSGPYRDYPAMDLVVQAMAGIISTTGHADQPPVKAGAAVCDFSAGVHLYGAIVTALFERERTGVGRVVEVSMQDAIYASLASNLGMLHARGDAAPARTGNRHGGLGVAPYNAYESSDGYVVIMRQAIGTFAPSSRSSVASTSRTTRVLRRGVPVSLTWQRSMPSSKTGPARRPAPRRPKRCSRCRCPAPRCASFLK